MKAPDIESELAHARSTVVPSLLWVLGIVVLLVAAALQEERESAPAQTASPDQVQVVSVGV